MSRFLKPFIEEYDALVFTMAEFLLPGLQIKRVAFIPPAIDPLATKNMDLPIDLCKRAMADSGIDLNRPLLVQVSRFDPWKDPLGVIQAYRLVKEAVPGIQLALIGGMAGDDPEGWRLLEQIEEEAAADADLVASGAAQVMTCNTIPHDSNRIDVGDLLAEGVSALFAP